MTPASPKRRVVACPLCGRRPRVVRAASKANWWVTCEDDLHYVELWGDTKPDAIRRWNKRAPARKGRK